MRAHRRWVLFQARRYEEALKELRSGVAVQPDDTGALWMLGFVLIAKNESTEAFAVLEKVAALTHRNVGSLELLATAYARAGSRTDALRVVNELKRRRQTSYVPAGSFINPYLALGDFDEAFASCERGFHEKAAILQWIKVHPFFGPVRNDPRFADLLHKVGLDRAY